MPPLAVPVFVVVARSQQPSPALLILCDNRKEGTVGSDATEAASARTSGKECTIDIQAQVRTSSSLSLPPCARALARGRRVASDLRPTAQRNFCVDQRAAGVFCHALRRVTGKSPENARRTHPPKPPQKPPREADPVLWVGHRLLRQDGQAACRTEEQFSPTCQWSASPALPATQSDRSLRQTLGPVRRRTADCKERGPRDAG